jgi:5-bromo-4-chloroindolyl phosphate hydrolysis protein
MDTKKTYKIVATIAGFFIGGLISFFIFKVNIGVAISVNIILALGYLYGFWQSSNIK